MITFKGIVISNNRRQDGTYNVKIRVTFRGVSRRLPTTLYCTQSDLTRTLRIKNGNILSKIDELIGRMREAVSDISPFDLERADVDWVVAHMKGNMAADNFKLDFFEWSDRFLAAKTDQTRKGYDSALNALARFIGKRELDINDLSRSLLLDFVDWYEMDGKMHWSVSRRKVTQTAAARRKGASHRYLIKLQHLYNAARERYNDDDAGKVAIPRTPFAKLDKHIPASQGQRSIGLEMMQEIVDARTDDAAIRMALDVFVVSFALMGANMADLWDARPFKGDIWTYNRRKTKGRRADNAEMRIRVPAQLTPFLARLREGRSGWWLSVLHDGIRDKDECTRKVNAALRRWCRQNGREAFTLYAARHTFATLARNRAGLDKALVDDMLCHVGDYEVADIYIEKDWRIINEANERVLALLHFPAI